MATPGKQELWTSLGTSFFYLLSRSVFAGGSCHNNELWFPRIIFRNFIIRSRVVIQFQRSSFSDTAEGSAMEQLWVFGTSEVEKLHDAAADERLVSIKAKRFRHYVDGNWADVWRKFGDCSLEFCDFCFKFDDFWPNFG